MFGAKKNPSKGVKVDMNETTATIDLLYCGGLRCKNTGTFLGNSRKR